jgi:hypothetical protein
VSVYAESCPCIRFFQKFLKADYSVLEFTFFHLLFQVSYDSIYPAISTAVSDREISPTRAHFWIHANIVRTMAETYFGADAKQVDLEDLRFQTKDSPHPDLIDFFLFAERMITAFSEVHARFHSLVRNLLTLIGWGPTQPMTESTFRDFFSFVDPFEKIKIATLWGRYKLDIERMKARMPDRFLTAETFIHFCSDLPDLVKAILSMPQACNFEELFQTLSVGHLALLKFLKQRFAGFLLILYHEVAPTLQQRLEPSILMVRDAFLCRDISTALLGYRRFLQMFDVEMTRERPYYTFASEVSDDDVKNIIDRFSSRECLALSWFPADAPVFSKVRAKAAV